MKDLKSAFRIMFILMILGWVFFRLGGGTDSDLYLGLATEITGAGMVIVLLTGLGVPDNEEITQLKQELAEIKELLQQKNQPETESALPIPAPED